MLIDAFEALPLWIPPAAAAASVVGPLEKAWTSAMSLGELVAAVGGRWAGTPRAKWLQSQLGIAQHTDNGTAARFIMQDVAQSRAITIDVLGPARVAPDVSISVSGMDGGRLTVPGPLIPVRILYGTRQRGAELAGVLQNSAKDDGPVPFVSMVGIAATHDEMDLATEQFAAASACLSDACKSTFDSSPTSWGGAFKLSFLAVKPPPEGIALSKKPVGVQLPCQAIDCPEAGRLRCSGCKSAFYCSKACQSADWIARHREWCKVASAKAASSSAAAATSSVGSAAAAAVSSATASASSSTRASVLLPVNTNAGAGKRTSTISMSGGPSRISKARPSRNYHKGEFVVKVQVPAVWGMPILIYDEAKTFQETHEETADGVPALAAMVRLVPDFRGMKAYFYAQREGDRLRVFLDKYAPIPRW